jgi:two-component system, chemotaxis family, protein-glutamate methylesterase/glutaminase
VGRLVVVGASTGGIEALVPLVSGLDRGFAATVVIVLHLPARVDTRLPEILARRSCLPVALARDAEALTPGRVIVAPPDRHVEVVDGVIRLVHGPRENGFRPAIDPLFRTAARSWGASVVAVLLSGGLQDGVSGLMAVRNAGGVGIVQDPAEALAPELPQRAIQLAGADHVLAISEIAPLLVRLAAEPAARGGSSPADPIEELNGQIRADMAAQVHGDHAREISVYNCPDCGGALWQDRHDGAIQLRCHVGHTYGIDRLHELKGEQLEAALWAAVRIFRERAVLSLQLAEQERQRANEDGAARYLDQAELADRNAAVIVDRLLAVS